MASVTDTGTIYPYELDGTISEIIAKLKKLRKARGDVYISHYSDREGESYFEYLYERDEIARDNFSFGEGKTYDGIMVDIENILKPWIRSK